MVYFNEPVFAQIMALISKGYTVSFSPDARDHAFQIRLSKDYHNVAKVVDREITGYSRMAVEDYVVHAIRVAERQLDHFLKEKEDSIDD